MGLRGVLQEAWCAIAAQRSCSMAIDQAVNTYYTVLNAGSIARRRGYARTESH
jgi:hypothetical protein